MMNTSRGFPSSAGVVVDGINPIQRVDSGLMMYNAKGGCSEREPLMRRKQALVIITIYIYICPDPSDGRQISRKEEMDR